MSPFTVFGAPPRSGEAWFSVGLASSFPDLGSEVGSLSQPQIRDSKVMPSCKVYYAPKDDASQRCEIELDDLHATEAGRDLMSQVLVFQYKGKFHAVDHVGGTFIQSIPLMSNPNMMRFLDLPSFILPAVTGCTVRH